MPLGNRTAAEDEEFILGITTDDDYTRQQRHLRKQHLY